MKKNKGFTLIEILAVIIILGILIIIAVPAVTRYIENSRREAYIDTAKQIIGAAKNYLNSDDELDVYDNEVTYYMPISCFKYENGAKSINGNFTLAYVGFVYKETDFDYYWVSVDEEGEGIRTLTSYDDLDVDKIESGIELSDIDTSMSVAGTTKTYVFNNDCSEFEENKGHVLVSFDANGGEFPNGDNINVLKYSLPVNVNSWYKVSHTSNIDEDGNKQTDYENNWSNEHISGSDRGNISQAHVVTIPGATALHVKITYGGESASWDWACMWQGSYPNYTAASNCGSSITGKLGGGNYTSSSNTKEYDVSGDTVTFAFKSDGSGVGDGYGYYAVITDKNIPVDSIDKGYEGTYKEPTREDYLFGGWEYNGQVYKTFSELKPTDNITYKAKWIPYSTLKFNLGGGYIYINNNNVNQDTTYKREAGTTLSFNGVYRNSTTYSSGNYTTTFNSNGGTTTPSAYNSTKYYTYTYTFNKWQLVGECDNFPSETSTSGTYTFSDGLGDMCTANAQWNSSYSGYYAYPFTLPAAPTRPGYSFIGWKSSQNGKIYEAGESYTPTGNYTMTAQWEQTEFNVTLNGNGGTFTGGSSTFSSNYAISIITDSTQVKYSHTENVTDTGYKSSDYDNNWTNANIRGTDRTSSSSEAHVISFPGAVKLNIDIYYNGESTSYDWVTIWAGSHPSYTAYNNYSSGIINGQKLGGSWSSSYLVNGNTLTNVGRSTFSVTGDTVTFGFRSDHSVVGNGYGYYAIIRPEIYAGSISNYQTPTRSGYRFVGWKSSLNNQIYTNISSIGKVTSDFTLTAQWEIDN